jgi:hypothetical protein
VADEPIKARYRVAVGTPRLPPEYKESGGHSMVNPLKRQSHKI